MIKGVKIDLDSNSVTVQGIYWRTIMRNYKTSYTIWDIKTEGKIITAAGQIIPAPIGSKIEVTGEWQNTNWGKTLSKSTMKILGSSQESMVDYLSHIPGVGEVTARQITEKTGESLYQTPDNPFIKVALLNIRGITQEKAESIIQYIKTTQEERKLFEFLSTHGGTYTACLRIMQKYGTDSLEKLMQNPYEVGQEGGLRFSVCDQIAMRCGFSVYSKIRIESGIKQTLKQGAAAGHTYLDYAKLNEQCRKLLNAPDKGWTEEIGTALIAQVLAQKTANLVWDENRLYSKYLYRSEVNFANQIKRLLRFAHKNTADIDKLCDYAQKKIGVEYAPQQKEAFSLLNEGGVVVLTGGPGTGKSTVINGLLYAYEMMYPNHTIKLCAPTGRASQRMKETTGREATTIHRLLEYRPFGDDITYKDANNPIEADLIVVDETSMISIDMADIFSSAIKSGAMLLLVGDTDQLPCVGAGNVLHDLIHCGLVPVVRLTKTYRQAETSLIIKNAKQVNRGYANLDEGDDFKIIMDDEEKLPQLLLEEMQQYMDCKSPFDVQVLTPSKKRGELSAPALNRSLQALLNPKGRGLRYGDTVFRPGDKVMTIRNNYSAVGSTSMGYYNGDIGVVKSVTDDSLTVDIYGSEFVLAKELLDDVILAYATTIHKSQGSEYKTVFIVLPNSPQSMLQRNLLYTAITRAKTKCVLLTTPQAVNRAVKRCDTYKRSSYLKERIQDMGQ